MEITRPIKEPRPTAAEQRALDRLLEGQGDPVSAQAVRLLIDRCGRYGCVYTRPSKASPGMKECPGWCEALEIYDKQRSMQAAAMSEKVKTSKLARDERSAIRALENGKVSTKDVFVLILLSEKCASDGCKQSDDLATTCPGWCAIARRAWDVWWER